MYYLTLTANERLQIDWVGYRYRHGDEFYRSLWGKAKAIPDDEDWDSEKDLTFAIPENVSWEIREALNEDNMACFDSRFAAKLHNFLEAIV